MRGFVPPLRLALLLCLGLAGAARAPAPTPAPAPAPSPAPRQNLHSIGAALPAADAVLPGSQFSLCELSEEEQVDLILSEEAKPFLTRVRPVEGGPRDVAVLVALYHVGRRGLPNVLVLQNRLATLKIPMYAVEVAYGDDPFVLLPGPRTLQLRTSSCMYQKERLYNVLERRVPQRFTKLLFLDSDVLLFNTDPGVHWYDEVSRLLEHADVLHPPALSGYLDVLMARATQVKCSVLNASANHAVEPEMLRLQAGMAWGFRRNWLQSVGGLFDYAVFGGGDILNAAAFAQLPVCQAKHPQSERRPPFRNCSGAHAAVDGSYEELYRDYWQRVKAASPVTVTSTSIIAVHFFHGQRHGRWAEPTLLSNANVSHVSQILLTNEDDIWVYRNTTRKGHRLNATICSYMHDPHSQQRRRNAPPATASPQVTPPIFPKEVAQEIIRAMVDGFQQQPGMMAALAQQPPPLPVPLPLPLPLLNQLPEELPRAVRAWPRLAAAAVLLPLACCACCVVRVRQAMRRRRVRSQSRAGGAGGLRKEDEKLAAWTATLFPTGNAPWVI